MIQPSNSIRDDIIGLDHTNRSYLAIASKIAFTIYFFFIFFGTILPFKEKTEIVGDISTSNPVNLIVFGSLFVISIIILISQRIQFVKIIKREKYFFIFLIWCLITISWSDHPFVSFKRYLQYITAATISLCILINTKDSNDTIKIFLVLLGIYVIISILSIVAIPYAKDPRGQWRGITLHKNLLGQISLIALIFFINSINLFSLKIKSIIIFLLILSIILLLGAQSSTSLFTLLILFGISLTRMADNIFIPIGIGKTVSSFLLISIFIVIGTTIAFFPEFLNLILDSAGKDLTFTGRIKIWETIWSEAETHLLQGAGFQGFWVVSTEKFEELIKMWHDIITQAHNGYLDIINEIGLIGLTLFVFILINFFVNLAKTKSSKVWKWFILGAIIINITESTFLIPRSITGVMFVFSYLALFSDLIKNEISTEKNKMAVKN